MFSEIAIRVENLSKCYHIYDRPRDRLLQLVLRGRRQYFREFWALRSVSFEVKKGETVGIVGSNGSGKSTLLQIICGTLNPTIGSVSTKGRIAALLELGSGFNPEFTGFENIYLNAAILGLSKDEIDERFDEIAAFADIGEYMAQPVKSYSSGMYVRLAFAVQAMIDPEILIVDEALAVGDEKFQRKCFSRLEVLKGKGCSILFVSHNTASIIDMCDKVLLLDRGERVIYGGALEATRVYQKLMYAPADQKHQLVQQYRTAEKTGQSISTIEQRDLPRDEDSVCDEYDPSLVPDTEMAYPVQGAEIHSFQIFNLDGKKVNLLRQGAVYRFQINGNILLDAESLFFAIHIRTISGAVITGQRYPEEGGYVSKVFEGESFMSDFTFKMDLLPGTYFVGGGVWSSNEPNCLHRILDATMFRVVQADKMRSFGLVNLMAGEPVLEITK